MVFVTFFAEGPVEGFEGEVPRAVTQFQTDFRFQMPRFTVRAFPPLEYSSISWLAGDGKIRSEMTTLPSFAKTSTEHLSTKMSSLTAFVTVRSSGAAWRPGNLASKPVSPDRLRSTNKTDFAHHSCLYT
jgi:hypothetical protein